MPYVAAVQLLGHERVDFRHGLVPKDATSVFRLILTAQQRQHRQLDTRYK